MNEHLQSPGILPDEAFTLDNILGTAQAAFRGITQRTDRPAIALDADMALQGTCALIAAILEIAPQSAANSELRTMSERMGKEIHRFAKAFRQHFEESGEHMMLRLGAAIDRPAAQPSQ